MPITTGNIRALGLGLSVHRQKRFILSLSLSLGLCCILGEAPEGSLQNQMSIHVAYGIGVTYLETLPSSTQCLYSGLLASHMGCLSVFRERDCLVYFGTLLAFKNKYQIMRMWPSLASPETSYGPLGWEVAAGMTGCKPFLGAEL